MIEALFVFTGIFALGSPVKGLHDLLNDFPPSTSRKSVQPTRVVLLVRCPLKSRRDGRVRRSAVPAGLATLGRRKTGADAPAYFRIVPPGRGRKLSCTLSAIFAVIALAGCHKRTPPPSIDGLTSALERTAEQTLAAPSLANEQVMLRARPGQIDARAAEVLRAASAAGGAAIRSLDSRGRVSILATIPEANAEGFKAALRHEQAPAPAQDASPPSTPSRLIEVLIENAAAVSPTP